MPHREDARHRHRARPSWGRWVRVGLFLLLVLLLLAAVLSVAPAIAARRHLMEGRDAVQEGAAALGAGRAGTATEAFVRAEDAFRAAGDDARSAPLRVLGVLPLIGRTPDAVGAIADSGALVARAGVEIARGAGDLPGELGALAPRNGAIPLRPIRRLAPALDRARALVRQGGEVMRASPDSWLLGPVVEPRREFVRELADVRRTVEAGAALTRTLPGYLGGGGTRRYFFGAQNPAELRGTGGFIGAYTILTATDGRISLGEFRTIQELPALPASRIEPPNPDYGRRYSRYGGAGFWHNINMTPDFPSAATAIENLWERVRGDRLDGVIVADPEALALLMRVAGPAEVPGTGITVNAGSVVPFLANEAYGVITDSNARKRLLGDVAEVVLKRFLATAASRSPAAAGRSLADAAAGGHLLLHSTDREVQAAFETARIAGRLANPEADYLSVVANNAGGNKVDYYADRTVRYEVGLEEDGSASAVATVRYENRSPRRGQPQYVIGPYPGRSEAGENVMVTSVFCATSCRPDGVARGAGPDVSISSELGHPVVDTVIRVPSGDAHEVEYRWRVGDGWDGDDREGVYRLTFQGQTTIRPTRLELVIRAPEGMHVTRAEPGMEIRDGAATWGGEPGDLETFEVEFARPLLSRLWRSVLDFLNTPLVGEAGA